MSEARPLQDHVTNIFKAIEFIEDNLTCSFSIAQVAKHAAISKWHFQRIFHQLVGETTKNYIRRRRLSIASKLLVESSARPADVAARVGFKSPESFSRAFLKQFKRTPGEFKKEGKLAMLPDFRPAISREYLEKMFENFASDSFEIQIVELRPAKFIGLNGKFYSCFAENSDSSIKIDQIWEEFFALNQSLRIAPQKPSWGFVVVPESENLDQNKCDYLASLEIDQYPDEVRRNLPDQLQEYDFPGGLYATFENSNPANSVVASLNYLVCVWLYQSCYEYDLRPEIECYPVNYSPSDRSHTFSYYLPIVKSES